MSSSLIRLSASPFPSNPSSIGTLPDSPQPSACEPSEPSSSEYDVEDIERQESEDEYDYVEEDEEEEEEEEEEEDEDEDEVETWVAIDKKRLATKKRKRVEAKKRNHQTEAFVRQLLKDEKAGMLDSFKDNPWAKKKKKGAEEEEEVVVDSKMTKKNMDVGTGPSNVGLANPGPVAPPAIDAPATPESSGNSSDGST